MSTSPPANAAQSQKPTTNGAPTGLESNAGSSAKPTPKVDAEAAKTGSFILQSIQKKMAAAAPPKPPPPPPPPSAPKSHLKPLPDIPIVEKKRPILTGQSPLPAAKRQKLDPPSNTTRSGAPAAKKAPAPPAGGAPAKGPRKLTPEEIEAKKKRAAELNAIFGGININKNSLKSPEKKIDLEAARKAYEAQLQIKIEMLEKKQAEMRKLALERKRAAAAAGGGAVKGKPGTGKKTGTAAQFEKRVVSLSELEKRIQSLKAKMTPGTATSNAPKPAPVKAAARIEEEEEDDDLDDFLDDNEDLDDFVVSDEEDWRTALRSLTKYDPKKYRDEEDDDDMAMEANYADIEREEKRSARIGKREDKMEELREKGLLKKGSGR